MTGIIVFLVERCYVEPVTVFLCQVPGMNRWWMRSEWVRPMADGGGGYSGWLVAMVVMVWPLVAR
jgi:hypothetical protein